MTELVDIARAEGFIIGAGLTSSLFAFALCVHVLRELSVLSLFDKSRRSVVGIDIGRWSVDLFIWSKPCVMWNERGYNGYWHEWGIAPLFCVDRLNLDEDGNWV